MSIKTYLKAAAVALPLALGGGKAAAQSQNVIKAAEKIVATDTLRTMGNDAKTLIIKSYKGTFNGNVVNGKIGNGTLSYMEKGRTVPVASLTNPKASLGIDGSFVHSQNLPGIGYKLRGTAEKGADAFDAVGIYSTAKGNHSIIGDVAYTRSFPLSRDFAATGKVGVEGAVHKVVRGDSYGQLNPHISAGAKFKHNFNNGVTVGAKAEVGGAMPFNFKTHTRKSVENVKVIANGEVEAGYKNITGFVEGGRDAVMGNNIGGGVRIKW